MLTIFRRHMKDCKWKSRKHRNCQRPIAVEGMLHGKMIRKSLELRSWEAAQKHVQDLEANGEREIVSLKVAGERFISARRTKGNTEETIKKRFSGERGRDPRKLNQDRRKALRAMDSAKTRIIRSRFKNNIRSTGSYLVGLLFC